MRRFFAGLFMALGLLIAGTSGLCTAAFLIFGFGDQRNGFDPTALLLPIGVGSVPFGIGLLMFFLGRSAYRNDG